MPGNDLLAEAGALPGYGQVVLAVGLLAEGVDVVALAGRECDGGGLLLGMVVPLLGAGFADNPGDFDGVGGVGIGAEPELGGFVAGDPEGVGAGGRRVDVTADAVTEVLGPV